MLRNSQRKKANWRGGGDKETAFEGKQKNMMKKRREKEKKKARGRRTGNGFLEFPLHRSRGVTAKGRVKLDKNKKKSY